MSKLYVFAIGGTGARVIKSLAMLLAAGVRSNFTEVVPIIIDPDKSGGDLNRTINALNDYKSIHQETGDFESNNFFKTKLTTLSDVISEGNGNPNVIDGFRYEIEGVQSDTFEDFIGYGSLDKGNKYLANLLFSDENLSSNLDVGFKGNPNIGSVVLNQFSKSDAFAAFASNFKSEDSIFIVSSIFGGTGASGFPLILKNIREGKIFTGNEKQGKPYQFLKDAIIGAITVQPYFKVSNNNKSKIDSQGFITKTKAALHYYDRNVTGNKSLNSMYYIGDFETKEYSNVEGGREQKNDAHFIELAAALSIIDFSNSHSSLKTVNGKATNQITFKEFGIENNTQSIGFVDLCESTNRIIRSQLSEYFYFNLYLKEKLKGELKHPYATAYTSKIDTNFIEQAFYLTLSRFNKEFRIWLGELYRNEVAFRPFNIEVVVNEKTKDVEDIRITDSSLFSIVNGVTEKKSIWEYTPFPKKNYELFIAHLNKAAEQVGNSSLSSRFMGTFSLATKSIVNQKLF
ncbi:MAG: hypothetical protein JWQ09_232 [Segetibacter sp.]|nr:hypothetical protein [Segetibacter sp.]